MMGAPSVADAHHLRELHLKVGGTGGTASCRVDFLLASEKKSLYCNALLVVPHTKKEGAEAPRV